MNRIGGEERRRRGERRYVCGVGGGLRQVLGYSLHVCDGLCHTFIGFLESEKLVGVTLLVYSEVRCYPYTIWAQGK